MKKLVIIPTFNENENIRPLLRELLTLNDSFDVLIVDNHSLDGTIETAQNMQIEALERSRALYTFKQNNRNGLGCAYLEAFEWAIMRKYDAVLSMDADFSHQPYDVPKVFDALKGYDFAIGSRYVYSGSTPGWNIWRRNISKLGGIAGRLFLGAQIYDWTGGMNAWTTQALQKMNLHSIQSEGFSIQFELKNRALELGLSGREVGIKFTNRYRGKSKFSLRIIKEAITLMSALFLKKRMKIINH